MAFFVDFALFFRTIDGLLRYGTVRCGTVRYGALKNSDKFALPIVKTLITIFNSLLLYLLPTFNL